MGEAQQQGGVLLVHARQGGPQRGRDTATRRPWRQWVPCRHREEGERERADRGVPHVRVLNIFFSFSVSLQPAAFSDLNEALNQFYKLKENSQRLPITLSTSTKFGVAKLKVLSNICS